MTTTMMPDALPLEAAGRAMRKVFSGRAVPASEPAPEASDDLVEADFSWRLVFAMALEGRAGVAHEFRANVLAAADRAVEAVDTLLGEMARAAPPPTGAARFAALAADLKRKYAYRAARWKTAEDLEYLAAESLAPSDEEFQRIKDSLPVPQSWLDDDSPCPF